MMLRAIVIICLFSLPLRLYGAEEIIAIDEKGHLVSVQRKGKRAVLYSIDPRTKERRELEQRELPRNHQVIGASLREQFREIFALHPSGKIYSWTPSKSKPSEIAYAPIPRIASVFPSLRPKIRVSKYPHRIAKVFRAYPLRILLTETDLGGAPLAWTNIPLTEGHSALLGFDPLGHLYHFDAEQNSLKRVPLENITTVNRNLSSELKIKCYEGLARIISP